MNNNNYNIQAKSRTLTVPQKPTVRPFLILTHSLISIANYHFDFYYNNVLVSLYSLPSIHASLNNRA